MYNMDLYYEEYGFGYALFCEKMLNKYQSIAIIDDGIYEFGDSKWIIRKIMLMKLKT